jgi:hypothetical protein
MGVLKPGPEQADGEKLSENESICRVRQNA